MPPCVVQLILNTNTEKKQTLAGKTKWKPTLLPILNMGGDFVAKALLSPLA
jgi:hypothetical protein